MAVPRTIVGFGDSVTGLYYHTGGRRAWPELLGAALRELQPGAPVTLVNAGMSGDTTALGLARIDSEVLSHRPELVVAMFGLNDVARGDGPQEYANNLREIVRRIRRAGSEIVLMTPNSIYPGDSARPPERVGEYAEIMRQVAAENKVPVAEGFGAFEAVRTSRPRTWERLMNDTIHPNLFGQALFAGEAAWVIAGRRCRLDPLPPGSPPLAMLRSKLSEGRGVRVVAMDGTGPAAAAGIRRVFPAAAVAVEGWEVPAGATLAGVAAQAGGLNRFAGHEPDAVVVAVPEGAGALDAPDYFRSYSWVLNYAQAMGASQWDCVAISPGGPHGPITQEVAGSVDAPWIDERGGIEAQFADWLG